MEWLNDNGIYFPLALQSRKVTQLLHMCHVAIWACENITSHICGICIHVKMHRIYCDHTCSASMHRIYCDHTCSASMHRIYCDHTCSTLFTCRLQRTQEQRLVSLVSQ